MIVLDTHTLVWWVDGAKRLSGTANKTIRNVLKGKGEILVSAISAWEISLLIQKGRLQLSMDVGTWLNLVAEINAVEFVPVDREIAVNSTKLPGKFHKDPADRIIVATARKWGVPVVTGDEKIIGYKHVKTIW